MAGPMCSYALGDDWVDPGTLAMTKHRPAGPLGVNACTDSGPLPQQVLLSPVFRETVQVTDNMSAPMTWDSYWRMAYARADKVLQAQANELLKRGNITQVEFENLVNARNKLVLEFRKPLSPFGKQYSEILKKASTLPKPGGLLAGGGPVWRAARAALGRVVLPWQPWGRRAC